METGKLTVEQFQMTPTEGGIWDPKADPERGSLTLLKKTSPYTQIKYKDILLVMSFRGLRSNFNVIQGTEEYIF